MARTNKKQEQIENKQKHLKSHSAYKKQLGSRDEPNLERQEATRQPKKTFLIICEGENTEPSYFNKFRLKTAQIKVIGEGYNTISLVERALELIESYQLRQLVFDEVWCVFDKDDFLAADFNNAITVAKNNNLQCAYSNQSFEYWLLLHFNDHQGGQLERQQCCEMVCEALEVYGLTYDYKGSKKIERHFFDLMLARESAAEKKTRIEKAIKRAESIYKLHNNNTPAAAESSTTVHLLVSEILKYL